MSKSLEQFGDLLALYDLGDDAWDALVAAAAEVVAQGIAPPGMVELASQPARGPRNVLELGALVAAARDETGMGRLDDSATALRATQGQIRRWRSGNLSDAELLSFDHGVGSDVTPGSDLDRLWILFVKAEEMDNFTGRMDIHHEIEDIADSIAQTADPWSSSPSV